MLPPPPEVNVVETQLVVAVAPDAAEVNQREDRTAFLQLPVYDDLPTYRIELPAGLAEGGKVDQVLPEAGQLVRKGLLFVADQNQGITCGARP